MVVHLFDADEPDLARAYYVNHAIGLTEAARTLLFTPPFERLSVKTNYFADTFEPILFDGLDSRRELRRNKLRHDPQLLAGTRGEYDDVNHPL